VSARPGQRSSPPRTLHRATKVFLIRHAPGGNPGSRRRAVALVAEQPDHVLGDEAADRAAGVHADGNAASRVKDETRRLQVHRAPATLSSIDGKRSPWFSRVM